MSKISDSFTQEPNVLLLVFYHDPFNCVSPIIMNRNQPHDIE